MTRVRVRGVRVWVTRVWVTRVWVRGVRLWGSYSSNSLLPCLAIATDNMFLFVLVGKDSDGSMPGRVVPVVEVDAASPRGLIYRTRTRIYPTPSSSLTLHTLMLTRTRTPAELLVATLIARRKLGWDVAHLFFFTPISRTLPW